MKFEKGKSGNPNGRPFGSKNKTTKAMREWLLDLVAKNKKQITDDLASLTPEKRLAILEKFMSYLLPKKFEADLDASLDVNIPKLEIEVIDKRELVSGDNALVSKE